MPLIQTGKISAVRKGEFDGKPFASLQFVEADRFGGMEIRNVYLPEGHNGAGFSVGQDVELSVTVSVNKKGGIAFRLVDDAAAANRSKPKAAA